MFIIGRLKEKTEEEAWDETFSYLDKKTKEKRKISFEKSRIIYTTIAVIILIMLVILVGFIGITSSELNVLSFILYESLIILSGLFVVLRIYFVGIMWTPLLYLLGVYINQKYGDKEKQWTIDDQIEFLWFSVIIIAAIGSFLINIIYSSIGYSSTDLNPLILVIWNMYFLSLIYYATSRSKRLKKSK